MSRHILRAGAHFLLLAALVALLGSLPALRGRELGPALAWRPYVAGLLALGAWAALDEELRGERALSLYERLRKLALAALAWPVAVELAGGDIERKRVVLLAAVCTAYALAGAPLVRRFVDQLHAGRKPAWGLLAGGLITLGGVLVVQNAAPELAHPQARRPLDYNLLLVSVDTTRADALGCYGNAGADTPAIDRLAAQGVVFERAIAQAPHTHGSMASLLTSKYPIEHRSVSWQPPLGREHRTLALELWKAGYLTAAFFDNPWLKREFGFDNGYEEFHEEAEVPAILDWLDAHKDERFFLHVHFLHPHGPYEPRSPWIERLSPDYDGPWQRVSGEFLEAAEEPGFARLDEPDLARIEALYASEVSALDADVGRVLERLDQLGLGEQTLVVFVADHGEEFLDHGALNHAHTLHEELVHVPLVLRLPGELEAGRRVAEQVELVDVLPTVLSLLKLDELEGARGRSLLAESPTPRIAVSQRYFIAERHLLSAREGRWSLQLCVTPSGPDRFLDWEIAPVAGREFSRRNLYRLYDLAEDPSEQRDVRGEHPAVSARLLAALDEWRAANDPRIPLAGRSAGGTSGISRQTLRELQALGYLGDQQGQ